MNRILAMVWFLIILMGLSFVGTAHFGAAQTGTNISGNITTDTTWTPTSSPYDLTGNIQIADNATLTIESGTAVNFNYHTIKVNGTFNARGTTTNKITLNGGQITFSKSSSNWNELASSGCILENTFLNQTQLTIYSSPKINNNTISYSDNVINISPEGVEIRVWVGSPIISNNQIIKSTPLQQANAIKCGGSALILNNTITGFSGTGIELSGAFGYELGGNSGTVTVSGNTITQYNGSGISVDNGDSGAIVIEGNRIIGNGGAGIYVGSPSIVQNNTIANNSEGIAVHSNVTISYNNILGNGHSVYVDNFYSNIDAANNWWGTGDGQMISQSIYDFRDNPSLGNVTFVPFLTSLNLQAPTIPANIIYPTPTTSPAIPEFSNWTIVMLGVAAAFVVVVVVWRKRKQKT